jgi:chromosome segregation ATPase
MPHTSVSLDLEPLKAYFAELYAQQSELEQYLEDSFRELDDLRLELGKFHESMTLQSNELERGQVDLQEVQQQARADAERAQAAQVKTLQQEYESVQSELQAELEQLRRQRDDQTTDHEETLRSQTEHLHEECRRLERDCQTARAEAEAVAASLDDQGNDRSAQSESEEKLRDTCARLAEAMQEINSKESQLAQLTQDRDELENELDSVRSRAAEVSDQLDQMKRESIEERAEWSAELKQMRRVLERQSDLLTTGPTPRAAAVAPVTAVTAVAATANAFSTAAPAVDTDPVLGTVMAQFDQIRKERAERRVKRNSAPI